MWPAPSAPLWAQNCDVSAVAHSCNVSLLSHKVKHGEKVELYQVNSIWIPVYQFYLVINLFQLLCANNCEMMNWWISRVQLWTASELQNSNWNWGVANFTLVSPLPNTSPRLPLDEEDWTPLDELEDWTLREDGAITPGRGLEFIFWTAALFLELRIKICTWKQLAWGQQRELPAAEVQRQLVERPSCGRRSAWRRRGRPAPQRWSWAGWRKGSGRWEPPRTTGCCCCC